MPTKSPSHIQVVNRSFDPFTQCKRGTTTDYFFFHTFLLAVFPDIATRACSLLVCVLVGFDLVYLTLLLCFLWQLVVNKILP
uniref:Uncharacterized protein n=1 Tax=Arundo donax TaxID=35708 RepID=A0A0A9AJV2_ARUDO